MRHFLKLCVLAVFISGCSDNGGGSAGISTPVNPPVTPPVNPGPVDPPPVEPPALTSFGGFVRDVLDDDANATPREVQELEFNQDATQDDFADLF